MAQLKYDQVASTLNQDYSGYGKLAIDAYKNLGDALKDAGSSFNDMYTEYKNNKFLKDFAAARDPNNVQSINEFMQQVGANDKYIGMSSDVMQKMIQDQGKMNAELDQENLLINQRKVDPLQAEAYRAYYNRDIPGARKANEALRDAVVNSGIRTDAINMVNVNDLDEFEDKLANSKSQRALNAARGRQADASARQADANARVAQETAYRARYNDMTKSSAAWLYNGLARLRTGHLKTDIQAIREALPQLAQDFERIYNMPMPAEAVNWVLNNFIIGDKTLGDLGGAGFTGRIFNENNWVPLNENGMGVVNRMPEDISFRGKISSSSNNPETTRQLLSDAISATGGARIPNNGGIGSSASGRSYYSNFPAKGENTPGTDSAGSSIADSLQQVTPDEDEIAEQFSTEVLKASRQNQQEQSDKSEQLLQQARIPLMAAANNSNNKEAGSNTPRGNASSALPMGQSPITPSLDPNKLTDVTQFATASRELLKQAQQQQQAEAEQQAIRQQSYGPQNPQPVNEILAYGDEVRQQTLARTDDELRQQFRSNDTSPDAIRVRRNFNESNAENVANNAMAERIAQSYGDRLVMPTDVTDPQYNQALNQFNNNIRELYDLGLPKEAVNRAAVLVRNGNYNANTNANASAAAQERMAQERANGGQPSELAQEIDNRPVRRVQDNFNNRIQEVATRVSDLVDPNMAEQLITSDANDNSITNLKYITEDDIDLSYWVQDPKRVRSFMRQLGDVTEVGQTLFAEVKSELARQISGDSPFADIMATMELLNDSLPEEEKTKLASAMGWSVEDVSKYRRANIFAVANDIIGQQLRIPGFQEDPDPKKGRPNVSQGDQKDMYAFISETAGKLQGRDYAAFAAVQFALTGLTIDSFGNPIGFDIDIARKNFDRYQSIKDTNSPLYGQYALYKNLSKIFDNSIHSLTQQVPAIQDALDTLKYIGDRKDYFLTNNMFNYAIEDTSEKLMKNLVGALNNLGSFQ